MSIRRNSARAKRLRASLAALAADRGATPAERDNARRRLAELEGPPPAFAYECGGGQWQLPGMLPGLPLRIRRKIGDGRE